MTPVPYAAQSDLNDPAQHTRTMTQILTSIRIDSVRPRESMTLIKGAIKTDYLSNPT